MNLSQTTKQPVHGYDTFKASNNNPAGTIIWSMSEATPLGYLLCNGAAVGRTSYPELFEVIGTKFGEGDGSTTFNLPNLIGKFIEGSETAGVEHEAGLPNITGNMGLNGPYSARWWSDTSFTGAIYPTNKNNSDKRIQSYATNDGANYTWDTINIDASHSNTIYGNSDTVQPPSVTALPYIKAYHNVSLNNSISVVEAWHNNDYTEWYRVYSDGFCEQGGSISTTTDTTNVEVIFLKPFINTPQIVTGFANYTAYSNSTQQWNADTITAIAATYNRVSNTGFYFSRIAGSHTNSWVAYGYVNI